MKKLLSIYYRLFFFKSHGLLVLSLALILGISMFVLKTPRLNKIDQIETTYYQKYQGPLTPSKIKQIEKEKEELNEYKFLDYLTLYKNNQITNNQYVENINKQQEIQNQKTAFKHFYQTYLNVKKDKRLTIVDTTKLNNFNYLNIDIVFLFVCLFTIYTIFLKDIDNNIWIYEQITITGKKKNFLAKTCIFSITIFCFLFIYTFLKVLTVKNLHVSILNLNWVNETSTNISLFKFIIICTFLYFLAAWILYFISINLRKILNNSLFILISLFLTCYGGKAFFTDNNHLVYFPFISFLTPGIYFKNNNISLLLIFIAIIFFIFIILFKKIKLSLCVLLVLLSGCYNKTVNYSNYNQYQNGHILENDKFYFIDKYLIKKDDFTKLDYNRDYSNDKEKSIYIQPNFIYYVEEDENTKLYSLSSELKQVFLGYISKTKRNFLNLNDIPPRTIEDTILGIIGSPDNYLILYPNKITNKDNKIVYQGEITGNYSIYNNKLYVVQNNNLVKVIDLQTFKDKINKNILANYIYFISDKMYYHNIKDDYLYQENIPLIKVEGSYIYQNTLYYSNNQGLFKYNLLSKENTQISTDKIHDIKVSKNGKHLVYITDSTQPSKELNLKILDINTFNTLYQKDY